MIRSRETGASDRPSPWDGVSPGCAKPVAVLHPYSRPEKETDHVSCDIDHHGHQRQIGSACQLAP